jgi:hypothetical protein
MSAPPPTAPWLRRVAAHLNVFSLRRVEARRVHLREYWQQIWRAGTSRQVWRLNPIAVTANFVRDAHRTVLFFYAMMLERY